MREIVVSMQNTLLSEAVAWSLAETGEFRVDQVLPGKTGDTFSLCRAVQADILLVHLYRSLHILLGFSEFPGLVAQERQVGQ